MSGEPFQRTWPVSAPDEVGLQADAAVQRAVRAVREDGVVGAFHVVAVPSWILSATGAGTRGAASTGATSCLVVGEQFGGEALRRLHHEQAHDRGDHGSHGDGEEEHLAADVEADRQETDCTDIAVGARHSCDLAADPLLDERHDGEHGTRTGLHEERTEHAGDDGERPRPRRPHRRQQHVADEQADEDDAERPLAGTEDVRHDATDRPGDEVDEGEPGGGDSGE